jgi:hypothetical protein
MKKLLAFAVFISSLSFPSIVRAELPVYPTAPFDAPCSFTYSGSSPYPNDSTSTEIRSYFKWTCKGPTGNATIDAQDPSLKDYIYTYNGEALWEVSLNSNMSPVVASWSSAFGVDGQASPVAFNMPSFKLAYFRITLRAALRSSTYSNLASNPSTGCCFWSRPLYSPIVSLYTNPNNVVTTTTSSTTTTITTVAPTTTTIPQTTVSSTSLKVTYESINAQQIKIFWNSIPDVKEYRICMPDLQASNTWCPGNTWLTFDPSVTSYIVNHPVGTKVHYWLHAWMHPWATKYTNKANRYHGDVWDTGSLVSYFTNNWIDPNTTTTTTIPQTTTTAAPLKYVPYVKQWKYVWRQNTYTKQIRTGALCYSGRRSTSTGSGACSWNGGVKYWIYYSTKFTTKVKYKCWLNQKTNRYNKNCITV